MAIFSIVPATAQRLATGLLFVLIFSGIAHSATLYEQSLALLRQQTAGMSGGEYSFVVMGDNRGNDAVFRKALQKAAAIKPLFILHMGDISDAGSRAETTTFLETVRTTAPGIPMFVVFGNHEQRSVFEQLIAPLEYSIDIPELQTTLAIANNADYKFDVKRRDKLREVLKKGRKLKFVAMHIPPKTPRWHWHTFVEGSLPLLNLLDEQKPAMVFYGHIHLYDNDVIKGTPQIISGGAGAPLVPFGFPGTPAYHLVLVRVKDGRASHEMIRLQE